MVVEASIEPTVQALLAYLRERDQQRDAELGHLREDLARSRADQIELAAQLAEARAQLALDVPKEPILSEKPFSEGTDASTIETPQTSSERRNGRPWWRLW